MRPSGRNPDQLRPVILETDVAKYAEGSCLIKMGDTHVFCTASLDDRLPPWLKGKGQGWVTAEYAMLPRATQQRTEREVNRGAPSGRTQEIQRLIGRSLRAVADLEALGEQMITVDCDVLEADGGTRTASITGAFIALADAVASLPELPFPDRHPLRDSIAAISAGVVDGEAVLDLDYQEDAAAEVDMNVVMTGSGQFVEIQGTGEESTFSDKQLAALLKLAKQGIADLTAIQRKALGKSWPFK